ncbi:hypothetical protein G9A89_003083 [Geosiphon pyriformis]|nr:hypothetical protein G9A89_003083 [Geosiphon pyriformis]
MAKIPQNKAQKRLENVVDKIITKIKVAIKEQQIKNNLSTQARAIYRIHTAFQNRPEILLNKAMNMITSNQLRKITNAQFEELQTQITQVIFKNKIQKILQEEELKKLDFDGA